MYIKKSVQWFVGVSKWLCVIVVWLKSIPETCLLRVNSCSRARAGGGWEPQQQALLCPHSGQDRPQQQRRVICLSDALQHVKVKQLYVTDVLSTWMELVDTKRQRK